MKKLLATAFFALIGAGAFAQTSQGTIVLSGSVGYTKTTQDQDNVPDIAQSSFNISPGVGYFIQDGLELGASLGYSQTKYNQVILGGWDQINIETKTNIFSFMPYVKKYFMVSDKVAFTGSALAGISKGTSTRYYSSDYNVSSENDISGFQLDVVPGISFFATEKIGINAGFGSFGYSTTKLEGEGNNSDIKTSTFGLNLDSSTLSVGFSYHFSR